MRKEKKITARPLNRVVVPHSFPLNNSILLKFLFQGKGDSFGENFAIDPSRPVVNSRASIRALTYCELRMISREDTLHILKQYPLFRENFIKDLEVTYNLRGDDTEKVSLACGKRLNPSNSCHTVKSTLFKQGSPISHRLLSKGALRKL